MSIEIILPALSPTMETGTIVKWHKKEGEAVAEGDVLFEVETDKATLEVEAMTDGTLGKILYPEGSDAIAVATVIGVILEDGESPSVLKNLKAGGATPKIETSPAISTTVTPTQQTPPPALQPTPQKEATMPSDERVIASPLAKRLAREAGINLRDVTPTGPHGRIVMEDVQKATANSGKPPSIEPAKNSVFFGGATGGAVEAPDREGLPPYESLPLSGMRKTIAQRLKASKNDVPHYYLFADCRLEALSEARKLLNTNEGVKISLNDFITKALAMALKATPQAHVMWAESAIRRFNQADIAIAVSTPSGLITPIVRGVDRKSLQAISLEIKDLAGRAKNGKLTPQDYTGGTFTISNLGMFQMKAFTAIINPPQVGILAVGAGEQRPVVDNGVLKIGEVMTVCLSLDHRAVDGALGAQLLSSFKGFVENPVTMLL